MRRGAKLMGRVQTPEHRFWQKVLKTDDCWFWTGTMNRPNGYGRFYYQRRMQVAHRISYEWESGPVSSGEELDHLCRNRNCVRPSHLEPVTHRENVLRGESPVALAAIKTHCARGHEFNEKNTNYDAGGRNCRICHRERCRLYRQRDREEVVDGLIGLPPQ